MKKYIPPFSITDRITNQIYLIAELISDIKYVNDLSKYPKLQRVNRIKSVYGSIAIENNTLSLDEVTGVINGKKIIAPLDQIKEAQNCFNAYDCLDDINPYSYKDLLKTHSFMTRDLCEQSGMFRTMSVGVYSNGVAIHIAPPHERVPLLISNLLDWVKTTDTNFLIASCVFHFEFEFIHPFLDGNGRMGRLWQTAILAQHHPIFKYLPIEEIIFDNRSQYYKVLGICQHKGDSTLFIEFMLNMILIALRNLKKNVENTKNDYSKQVNLILKALDVNPKSSAEIMKILKLKNQPNFYYNYLKPALDAGLIKKVYPNKPRSRNQKYYKK